MDEAAPFLVAELRHQLASIERERRELFGRIVELEREREELVKLLPVIAHQLFAPLQNLELLAQTVVLRSKEPAPPEAGWFGARGERMTAQLGRLTDLLRALFEIGIGRPGDVVAEPCQLSTLIESVRATQAKDGQGSARQLEVDVAADLEGPWHTLRVRLLLDGLLANATEHGSGGPVLIGVARVGKDAVIRIADSGPGMLTAAQAALQGAAPGPLPMGHGLGLRIVRRLADLLDATLEVEVLAGHGTTVRIVLRGAVDCSPRVAEVPHQP